jgi:hypothetical protein
MEISIEELAVKKVRDLFSSVYERGKNNALCSKYLGWKQSLRHRH